ncbi:lasso peptide biosynthesis B2 protein [Sphingomonas sp.]|uniref:lasso peptide biosynthesis B2 protein n=1 Tax=Sphingomonas sp. TaxID=28214 RepID=UPI003D6C89C8
MPYMLRAGLSFCAVEDRLLFLDLPADRYFCLSRAAESAFTHLYRGARLEPGDRTRLAGLARATLLVESDGAIPIAPCPAPPTAVASLLDSGIDRAHPLDLSLALLHLSAVRIELRLAGFARSIARLRRRKARRNAHPRCDRVAAIATAFDAAGAFVSAHDRCLPRAIAITHRLLALGVMPDLVVAVQLAPFQAHAWVQWRDVLVNERVEVARQFTPILVV